MEDYVKVTHTFLMMMFGFGVFNFIMLIYLVVTSVSIRQYNRESNRLLGLLKYRFDSLELNHEFYEKTFEELIERSIVINSKIENGIKLSNYDRKLINKLIKVDKKQSNTKGKIDICQNLKTF